jgi:hypothetical protein
MESSWAEIYFFTFDVGVHFLGKKCDLEARVGQINLERSENFEGQLTFCVTLLLTLPNCEEQRIICRYH